MKKLVLLIFTLIAAIGVNAQTFSLVDNKSVIDYTFTDTLGTSDTLTYEFTVKGTPLAYASIGIQCDIVDADTSSYVAIIYKTKNFIDYTAIDTITRATNGHAWDEYDNFLILDRGYRIRIISTAASNQGALINIIGVIRRYN